MFLPLKTSARGNINPFTHMNDDSFYIVGDDSFYIVGLLTPNFNFCL